MKDGASIREIETPEGVLLPFRIAPASDRIAAFGVDVLIITLGAALLGILAALVSLAGGGPRIASLAFAVLFIALFAMTSLYFAIFELLWAGQTPGKRRVGLRVIAREGGPVSGEAILARNLTRELEIFLPLGLFLGPAVLAGGAPGWTGWLAGSWVFVLAVLPLFNRDRLRCGDLVAGTLVVREPKVVLLPDLAATVAPADEEVAHPGEAAPRFVFTEAQLSSYGIYELQVLESVLQRTELEGDELLVAVARRIARRIEWNEPLDPGDVKPFLQAFYLAQRRRLEQRLLFGERKERKS
jgi:uncharacterized RDD family membrane protein YckC